LLDRWVRDLASEAVEKLSFIFVVPLCFNHLHGGDDGVSKHTFLCGSCSFSLLHTRSGVHLIAEDGVMLNCQVNRIVLLFY